jgi:hypothetical protein
LDADADADEESTTEGVRRTGRLGSELVVPP